MLNSVGYLHINIISDYSKSKSHLVTSVHVDYVEYCLMKTVSMLSFS